MKLELYIVLLFLKTMQTDDKEIVAITNSESEPSGEDALKLTKIYFIFSETKNGAIRTITQNENEKDILTAKAELASSQKIFDSLPINFVRKKKKEQYFNSGEEILMNPKERNSTQMALEYIEECILV